MRRRALWTLPWWPLPARAAIELPPLAMPGMDRTRRVRVWLPPGHDGSGSRWPVLYLHDGQNLAGADAPHGGWAVDRALAGLPQAILVGIDHGRERRVTELNPWSNTRFGAGEGLDYLRFVVEAVKPQVDARFRTRPGRAHTAIGGSSLGGLISLAALHAHPAVFGAALVLSPAYWIAPEVFELPLADARVWQSVGTREGARTLDDVRRMQAWLSRRPGVEARLEIVPDAGHDEAAWRAQFPHALRWWLG